MSGGCRGGETKEEGTEFPPDLLLDLLGPAVSIKRSPQGLTGMSSEKQLRTLSLSSLDQRRLKGNLIAPCSFLRRGHGEGGAELYFLLSSDRTRGSSSELCLPLTFGSISLATEWSDMGTGSLGR